jgi:hypothetical protein
MRSREPAPETRPALVAERSGLNLYAEYSLHAQLKSYLARPGDRLEALVDGKVVDLVRSDGELVEVQTGNLHKIAPKVLALAAAGRKVRVAYPVAAETTIRRLDPKTGELVSTRKSPKRGDLYTLFDDLVNAPTLIAARNVSIEVLFVKAVDVKVRDGTGSWWRKGDRREDRALEEVLASKVLRTRADWLGLVPKSLPEPWSSSALGDCLGIGADRARKILYCFARSGLVAEAGKDGRRKLYKPARRASRRSGFAVKPT